MRSLPVFSVTLSTVIFQTGSLTEPGALLGLGWLAMTSQDPPVSALGLQEYSDVRGFYTCWVFELRPSAFTARALLTQPSPGATSPPPHCFSIEFLEKKITLHSFLGDSNVSSAAFDASVAVVFLGC